MMNNHRRRLSIVGTVILLIVAVLLKVPATLAARASDLGTATVFPESVLARTWNKLTVTYTAPAGGIAAGGGLRVQLPKSFLNSPHEPQTDDPDLPYFVYAASSNPMAVLGLTVERADLRAEQNDPKHFTFVVTVLEGMVSEGETVAVRVGHPEGEGRGAQAPMAAAREPIGVAVDTTGSGTFEVLADLPQIRTTGLRAQSLKATLPSMVVKGTPVTLSLVALDKYGNNAPGYVGTVDLHTTDPMATCPESYAFTAEDQGIAEVEVIFRTAGIQRVIVTGGLGTVYSNPIVVREEEPQRLLFWGDLHVHSEFSPETFCYGYPEAELLYARDVQALDFYSFLDHAATSSGPLTLREWGETQRLVEEFYVPGHFIPLLGYEWSSNDSSGQGHRGVYYRGTGEAFYGVGDYPTAPALWEALRLNAVTAITVPHHTGLGSDPKHGAVDWTDGDPQFERLLEVFQAKGFCEFYDPTHPLSYENLTPGTFSVEGPHYARDAWAMGRRLGVIASSDEHGAMPGRTGYGLAAVYAPELTREALFDALYARHSYGTTGERIILDFRADGHIMGDEFQVTLPYRPRLSVTVVGTGALDYVEVVKLENGVYSTLCRATPNSWETAFTCEDPRFSTSSMYYVRVRQVGQVANRDVMAWSSPIWIDVAGSVSPTATSTVTPAATTISPTATATATSTATPTAVPTATDKPDPKPTPTPALTVTPTPVDPAPTATRPLTPTPLPTATATGEPGEERPLYHINLPAIFRRN
ncbi:MAG: DUF3604 domain-containing protein [Anaerolineae bacterium]|nr:DUF3604 domain-containing protein [Anaerolineae bacterium]